ncbi:MAG: hypothetical protein DMF80_15670 [Acidobacteria bacterium]|nr:MAG: hypothetical protein DMF80_15670 [Acidobacteriota bacterium]
MTLLLALLLASPLPSETHQLVLSVAAGWSATQGESRRYERAGPRAPWRAVGPAFPVSLGRSGLAWGRGLHPARLEGPVKKEGDGRAPAGAFDLRLVTGYAPSAPPGTRMPYRQATESLECVDDPTSAFYNQLADTTRVVKDWSSAEDMRRDDELYRFVVWVGHNDAPVAPGAGSCIFLHLRRDPASTTAGCTAFEPSPMEALLRWLDPAARPVLVQLPEAEYRSRAAAWELPPPR